MTPEQARAVVPPFYESLDKPASKDVRALIEGAASPDWRSFAGESVSKGRDEFIQQVAGFGKLIPDLAWEIKEVLVDGDRIVVRSEARGTPAADFMGTPHSGKSFAVRGQSARRIWAFATRPSSLVRRGSCLRSS